MTKNTKKKIAILGGGMGSMVTAFELTSQANWQDLYDITLYQLGWRLGGKGASGRNLKQHPPYSEPDYRIEEHGFHIFFGFYANTFRVMKECYDGLQGEPGIFPGIENAFQPHNFIVFSYYYRDNWAPWYLHFPYFQNQFPWPENEVEVGSLWSYILKMLEFMLRKHMESDTLDSLWEGGIEEQPEPAKSDLLARLNKRLETPLNWENLVSKSDRELLELAHKYSSSIADDVENFSDEDREPLLWLLDRFTDVGRRKLENAMAKLEEKSEPLLLDAIRILIICNLGYAIIRGTIVNKIFDWRSFNDLDRYDFRTWVGNNGGWDRTVNSPLVQVMYDLLLAFPGGIATPENGQLGVAATVRWIWRMIFTYKGAIMWKMNAGMGDTIFAPLYKELKKRGVKFEFFHRVTNLGLNSEKNAIASIQMARQVTLKNPSAGYDPLIEVKGLHCWPSEPLYDQIVEGEQLQREQINLESFWTPWKDVETITLNYQDDFDIVVQGISIAAFPFICKELEANTEWKEMVENIQTVTTQGGQLWLKPTLDGLGWKQGSPVMGTYVEPLDTYADMTHLIERENWPSDRSPNNIAYFTGVMEDPGIPPASDRDFPQQQQQKISERVIDWLQTNTAPLWPDATTPENPRGLNWDLLLDLEDRQGEQRFYSQFWRINITPSERYVLAIPDSYKYRLRPDSSRKWDDRPRAFQNLYLTGDWVDNSFNSGCIEATTMAAMQAARSIIEQQFGLEYHRRQVIGENDAWPKPQLLNFTIA